jgi:hypothetical protein
MELSIVSLWSPIPESQGSLNNCFSFRQVLTTAYRKQEVLGRTNHLLSLIRQGSHWKRRVQQFLYCCVCTRYLGNVSTEPLYSNDRGIFTEPFPINDKGNFTEPLPSNDKGGIHKYTHTRTATLSHKPNLFLQNKESRLKTYTAGLCILCI